jgi:hypothetical protein
VSATVAIAVADFRDKLSIVGEKHHGVSHVSEKSDLELERG